MAAAARYGEVGEAGWAWVLNQVRSDGSGPWMPETVSAAEAVMPAERDNVYSGIGGLAFVLAELRLTRSWSDREHDVAEAIVRGLLRSATTTSEASLFAGLGGAATAVRLLAPGSEEPLLRRLSEQCATLGWPSTLSSFKGVVVNDLLLGTAGVVLAGAWTGGPLGGAVAASGAAGLLSVAERTENGLDWLLAPKWHRRSPNYSHGTAGIATALAVAGHRLGDLELVEAARQGAQHLVGIGDLSGDGFLLPHHIPDEDGDEEPVTFSWCQGPTGTSYLFAALRQAGVKDIGGIDVAVLHRRCLHSVATSGVPDRLRPGFWDNDGRCCGTAGVGDVFLDAAQNAETAAHAHECLAFAVRLGDALLDRAVRDEAGARWRFVEHRRNPSLLDPGTGWMQGTAGIAAFLLRLARVLDGGLEAPVVDRPDQWWAVPAKIRTSGTGSRGA